MTKAENYDFIGSYNNQRVTEIDAERSVNLFEYIDPLGKKPKVLINTSGLINTDIDVHGATFGYRAQFVFNNFEYDVIGNTVLRVDALGNTIIIGHINSFTGYVGVDANTFQVIFVDGKNGWIWDTIALTFTQIVDINFPANPIDVCFLDEFFIVANGGTNEFRLSQLNNGINWTPLQQGTITSHPGTIVACKTLHRRLFLFSQFYTEVWENAGIGVTLPFRRVNSALMEYGTPSIASVSVGFDKMFFLSQDRDGLGSVMEVIGTQSVPVSNRALDFQLAQYAALGQVSDCRSFLIKENGLIFYRMNFTQANHTFVYNVTLSNPAQEELKLWHEEEVLNGDRHPAQTHAYLNGINYVGDYQSPIRYQVDSQTFTNAGENIRRMRIGRAFVPGGYNRTRVDRFQLDLLQGNVALAASEEIEVDLFTETDLPILTETDIHIILEQGQFINSDVINPAAYLSVSKDGGQSYGYIMRAPMGNVGVRTFRTVWRKLGVTPRGQAFVPKVEFFDPIPIIILGAAWAYEVLPE